ncbi:MAG TPA: arsenate reductase ArsC [Syntrophales bacterium]|nr:arsenate reductase ArsC [Syntrophales bacterium]
MKQSEVRKENVLFVCIHNSARSQMAEAWLNHLHGDRFEAHSAGLASGKLNPLAVAAMAEAGIDISRKKTQTVHDLIRRGESFSYVITVCDDTGAEQCPVFPGNGKRLHWSFPDPAQLTGTDEEKFVQVRKIRNDIRAAIESWYAEISSQ